MTRAVPSILMLLAVMACSSLTASDPPVALTVDDGSAAAADHAWQGTTLTEPPEDTKLTTGTAISVEDGTRNASDPFTVRGIPARDTFV